MLIGANELQSEDTPSLARGLLGKRLVLRSQDGRVTRWLITETEAYDGPEDRASHASRGRTPRNAPMFEAGGLWYVYLCYGMHEMLNLVTGPKDYPAAVLIRGVKGHEGPGKLTNALGIDRRFNGLAVSKTTGLWLEDGAEFVADNQIQALPRIGVAYAGPIWSAKPWRFLQGTGKFNLRT
jgi:DNA-3-methyladenine glycosylase